MSKISVDGDRTDISDAIVWCGTQFGIDWGKVDYTFPSNFWQFSFTNPKQALHFALKWV